MASVVAALFTGIATGLLTGCTADQIEKVPHAAGESQTVARTELPRVPSVATSPRLARAAPNPRIDEIYRASAIRKTRAAKHSAPEYTAVGDISLDFQGADIGQVVRRIVGDLLGSNVIIDPEVRGTVTLTTNRPIRRDALMPVLEAVLSSQGAVLVEQGGLYRVSRATSQSALAAGGIGFENGADRKLAGYGIYPLEFLRARELQTILKPLLPKTTALEVDVKRNFLIVGGTSSARRLASETAQIFDVEPMTRQNFSLLSLKQADAQVVVAELEKIFGDDVRSKTSQPMIQFIPIKRLNAILTISQQFSQIEKSREWVYRLDRRRSPRERRIYIYYVQHRNARKLVEPLKALVNVFSGDRASADGPEPSAGASAQLDSNRSNTELVRSSSEEQAPVNLSEPLFTVDEERNTILIMTTPDRFAQIEQVLERLDVEPLQVMIETTIIEVALRDTLRYGVQYAFSTGGFGISDDEDFVLTRGTATAVTGSGISVPIIAPQVPGFSFTALGSSRARVIIDTLSDLTEVNLVSSPNIVVENNKTAQIRVGDEVPIVTQTTTSAVTDNPLIVNSVQYRNTGVNLEVSPRVNASGMVSLEIVQEVSDVTTTTSSTIDSPTIQNRSLLTTVNVKSGDTVFLGGLIRESATDAKSGIPILHDLPLIGWLFGQTATTAERVELVVLIKPVIISSSEDAQIVRKNLRHKFLALLERERVGVRQPRRIEVEDPT